MFPSVAAGSAGTEATGCVLESASPSLNETRSKRQRRHGHWAEPSQSEAAPWHRGGGGRGAASWPSLKGDPGQGSTATHPMLIQMPRSERSKWKQVTKKAQAQCPHAGMCRTKAWAGAAGHRPQRKHIRTRWLQSRWKRIANHELKHNSVWEKCHHEGIPQSRNKRTERIDKALREETGKWQRVRGGGEQGPAAAKGAGGAADKKADWKTKWEDDAQRKETRDKCRKCWQTQRSGMRKAKNWEKREHG